MFTSPRLVIPYSSLCASCYNTTGWLIAVRNSLFVVIELRLVSSRPSPPPLLWKPCLCGRGQLFKPSLPIWLTVQSDTQIPFAALTRLIRCADAPARSCQFVCVCTRTRSSFLSRSFVLLRTNLLLISLSARFYTALCRKLKGNGFGSLPVILKHIWRSCWMWSVIGETDRSFIIITLDYFEAFRANHFVIERCSLAVGRWGWGEGKTYLCSDRKGWRGELLWELPLDPF